MRWLERVKQWLEPPHSERVVRARELAVGDVIAVGGRTRRVSGVRRIYGSVRLTLDSGELLVLGRDLRYQVTQDRPAHHAPAPHDAPQTGPCDSTAAPTRGDTPHVTIGLTDQGRAEPTHGQCWLCDTNGVPVIWLGPVQLPAHTAPLMACQPCTQRLHDRAQAYTAART